MHNIYYLGLSGEHRCPLGYLFLDCFTLSFVKVRWELREIRGTERLFIDKFGHDVQQPSP